MTSLLIGLVAVVVLLGFAWWNDKRRRFFLDPDNAAPAFGPELPHAYSRDGALPCCVYCGGGKNHSVHHGKRWVPEAQTIKEKYLK